MNYFKDVKVGDKVWDIFHKTGEVVELAPAGFKIKFESMEELYFKHNNTEEDDIKDGITGRLVYYCDRPIIFFWTEELSKKYGDNRNKFIHEFSEWIKE